MVDDWRVTHLAEKVGGVMVGTWSFSAGGLSVGLPGLQADGDPLDACVAACSVAEGDLLIDSVGLGGLPDSAGRVSLDACVMRSPAACGMVCCVGRHLEVTRLARAVMEHTPHTMLAGQAADDFANTIGMNESELLAPAAKAQWEKWRSDPAGFDLQARTRDDTLRGGAGLNNENRWWGHDTIGVLARNADGRLAGACSTSGTPFKLPGRVGDSPIIGQGLFVEPAIGMAVATGEGELIAGTCATHAVVSELRAGATPIDAIEAVLLRIKDAFELAPHHQVGLIASNAAGEIAAGALREGFKYCYGGNSGIEVRDADLVLLHGT